MISSEQVKARIRQISKDLNLQSNIVLRTVIFEFFLEKLSLSKYKDKFIIKGGFLVSAMTKINLRTTMDLDITLRSLSIEKYHLKTYINDILFIPTHDLLSMTLERIDDIHEDADYKGLRASVLVNFDGLKEKIKIDFTAGDILTPKEVNFTYKTVFQDFDIHLKSYNVETVLAEKIETILSRGPLNTRMRDFYDVFTLSKLKKTDMDLGILRDALINTSTYRKTFNTIFKDYKNILVSIEFDDNMKKLWENYQKSFSFAKDVTWEDSMHSIWSMMKDIMD